MGRVGRFQVMATLQAARAAKLGLNLDEARSWGLNRAVFYAAAKRGFRKAAPAAQPASLRGHGAESDERELSGERGDLEYSLGGEKAFLAGPPERGIRFKFGDEEQTPRDFEWQIERRFADWEAAWREAQAIIERAGPADLENQHCFYEHVYKPNRDKLAAQWSASPAPPAQR